MSSSAYRYVLDARTANDHFPGIGRYVLNLARAIVPLLARDEDLTLLHDPSRTSHWDLETLCGEQMEVLETSVTPFSPRQQWTVPRLLRGLSADLYHSPYYLMPYRPGVSTVLTLYDLIPQRYPALVSARARLLFRLTTRLALRTADHVIAISEATRHDVLDAYPIVPDKITAVPLAPAPHFQPQTVPNIDTLRHRLDLPPRYVLYLGINKPHKNLVRLVQAWQSVHAAHPDVPLVIAGTWDPRYPQARQIVADARLDTAVHFLGPVADADLPALYSGAALFIFPSLYEGFGLPVVEAMACGTAVACSRQSSLPEVGGDAAVYFDPLSSADIAAKISHLLSDETERRQRQQQSRRQAARFTWQNTAAATLAIYRQTLTKNAD